MLVELLGPLELGSAGAPVAVTMNSALMGQQGVGVVGLKVTAWRITLLFEAAVQGCLVAVESALACILSGAAWLVTLKVALLRVRTFVLHQVAGLCEFLLAHVALVLEVLMASLVVQNSLARFVGLCAPVHLTRPLKVRVCGCYMLFHLLSGRQSQLLFAAGQRTLQVHLLNVFDGALPCWSWLWRWGWLWGWSLSWRRSSLWHWSCLRSRSLARAEASPCSFWK